MTPLGRLTSSWVPSWLVAGLIWGSSFAFIAVGLRSLTPVQVASARLVLGALTLLAISAALRVPLPRGRRTWGHLAVVALLLNLLPGILFAVGQQHVPSVVAGIINAMTPLATLAVILVAYPEEKPTLRRVLGLLAGFAGVALVLGVWRGLGEGQWSGVVACLAAITCYGLALPYSRRHLLGAGQRPLSMVTGQVALSAVLVVPVLLLSGTTPHAPVTRDVVVAMLCLGVLGSGVAYALNFRVVAIAGASTASTVTYLSPVIATVVGVVALGERISWNEPVGTLVILLGVAVAQNRARLKRVPPVQAPAPTEPPVAEPHVAQALVAEPPAAEPPAAEPPGLRLPG